MPFDKPRRAFDKLVLSEPEALAENGINTCLLFLSLSTGLSHYR
jgi:hypothetical protein